MPPPNRGRSLRHPGYAHRDLIQDGQQTETIAKHGVNHQQKAGTEEWFTSEDAISKTSDESQLSSENARNKVVRGSDERVRERPSLRSATATSTQGQESRLIRRQTSIKAGQIRDVKAGPVADVHLNSSNFPLPSQLSRSSSLRQPSRPVHRGEAVKRLHSRNTSITENSTGSSRLGKVSTASLRSAQEDFSTNSHLIPPPKPASTASRSAAAHRRSQSGSVLLPGEPARALPGAQNRFTSMARPQFATYQQQFSPRKQDPQAEPIKVQPSTCYANSDFTHATALQDELLHLKWIYLSSHKTLQAWIESGERKINEQHKKHIQEFCNVSRIEQNQQNRINGAALRDWLAIDTGKLSLKKVESLSQCVQTLTDLTQPYERLSDVIGQFEAWYEITIDTVGDRSGDSQKEYPQFLRPLGQPWAETVATLVRAFETCLRNLQQLGSGDGSSGLGLVLDGHTLIAKSILDELIVMQVIQSMVLDQEDDWITCEISKLSVARDNSEVCHCDLKRPAAWDRVP